MTSNTTPAVGTPAWKTFVADAIAKDPARRTDAEREAIASAISGQDAPATSMSWFQASRNLGVGDVIMLTDEVENYPFYRILPGARLVVVANFLEDLNPALQGRLVPADKRLMVAGDLSDWGDVVHLMAPDTAHDSLPGVADDDEQNPGHAWNRFPLGAQERNDALPLAERIAAVFALYLNGGIGEDNMAEVVRRNATPAYANACASHDFCDPNMYMLDALKAIGIPAPVDCEDGTDEHEAACALWNEAWEVAKRDYFAVYAAPADEDETPAPAGNDDPFASLPPMAEQDAINAHNAPILKALGIAVTMAGRSFGVDSPEWKAAVRIRAAAHEQAGRFQRIDVE